jgi:hypothetical protein
MSPGAPVRIRIGSDRQCVRSERIGKSFDWDLAPEVERREDEVPTADNVALIVQHGRSPGSRNPEWIWRAFLSRYENTLSCPARAQHWTDDVGTQVKP